MKIIFALLVSVALMACGGKSKKNTTPDNKTGTTETKPEEGSGSAAQPTPPTGGADPCAGQ